MRTPDGVCLMGFIECPMLFATDDGTGIAVEVDGGKTAEGGTEEASLE